MGRERKLEIVLAGSGRGLSRTLGDADRRLSGFGSRMARIGKVAAVGFAGAVAGGVGKSLVDVASFQERMNEVFTLLPGISAGAMDAMTDQVKGFSREFGVLPDQVVPALYQALSAGVPQENVFTFLETAQKAARAGVTDLEVAVDGISSVVNAYGSDVLSAAQASDLMFTAVKAGKTTFEELSASLFQVTPVAAATGVQFGDVTAALAALTAQGVPTSVATTQLRQLFTELSKDGSKVAATFEKVSGKSFRDFVAGGGNVQQALALLRDHAADSGLALGDLFSSTEAGSAALGLAKGDFAVFSKNLELMGDSASATEKAFSQMDRGLAPIVNRIRANVAVAFLEIGEAVAPVAEDVLGQLGRLASRVGPVISDLGDKVGVGLSAMRAAFSGEGVTSDGFVGVMERIGVAARGLVDDFRARWPQIRETVGAVLASIGSAASVFVAAIVAEWPTIRATIASVADVVQTVLRIAFEDVLPVIVALGRQAIPPVLAGLRAVAGVVRAVTGFFADNRAATLALVGALVAWRGALAVKRTIDTARVALGAFRSGLDATSKAAKGLQGFPAVASKLGTSLGRIRTAASATTSGIGRLAGGFRDARVAESGFSGRLGSLGGSLRRMATLLGSGARSVLSFGRAMAGQLVAGLRSAVLGFRALTVAILSNPIGIIAAAVVALGAAFVLAYQKIEPFRNAVDAVGRFLRDVFLAVISAVGEHIASTWAQVAAVTSFAWGAIRGTIETVAGVIGAVIRFYVGVYTAVLGTAWNVISTVVRTVWGGIRDTISGVVEGIASTVGSVIGGLSTAWSLLWEGMRSVVDRVWGGIKRIIESVVNGVIAGVNTLIGAWNALEFSVPGWDPPGPGPKFGGFTIGVPDLPKIPTINLGAGGIVLPFPGGRPANIAERGVAEAVIPLDDERASRWLDGGPQVVIEAGAIRVEIDARGVNARDVSKVKRAAAAGVELGLRRAVHNLARGA